MIYVYNKSVRGFSHIENNTLCQDYSEKYLDKEKQIITCADGHGSKIYIRSDRGSRIASNIAIELLKECDYEDLLIYKKNNNFDKLKLEILCKWHEAVEKDLENDPLEESNLTEKEKFKINNNPHIAYGTTLNAVMMFKDLLLCIQIGDGGMFLIKDREIINALPENDGNVANLTNSLCGDDAYDNLFINVFNKEDYDGVFIATDGVLAPYATYQNLQDNLINVIVNLIKDNAKEIVDEELDNYFTNLGGEIGNGDDVSAGIIYYK